MAYEFNSGYAIEQENREEIWSTAYQLPFKSSDSELPAEVDPRFRPEFANSWLRTEFQYMGGCQGYSLTENGEYCYTIGTGDVMQFNPVVSYVMSQKFDNISGDSGSTLSGGTKAASEIGFCEHSKGLSEREYPRGGWKAVTQEMLDDAKSRKLRSHTDIRDPFKAKTFLGGMMGIGQYGTKWTTGLASPTPNGVITSIQGRVLGGHAYTLAGYRQIDNLPAEVRRELPKTKYDWLFVNKNSHGSKYGENGWAYLIVEFFQQLAADSWTVILGRSDMEVPDKRKSKVDFTTPEGSFYA